VAAIRRSPCHGCLSGARMIPMEICRQVSISSTIEFSIRGRDRRLKDHPGWNLFIRSWGKIYPRGCSSRSSLRNCETGQVTQRRQMPHHEEDGV
jgi:hypothetical protein